MNEFIGEFLLEISITITLGILGLFRKIIWRETKKVHYKFIKKNENVFDKLLIYLYKEKGHSVSLSYLKEEFDLSEVEIINRLEKAENQDLVKNYPTFKKKYSWILTQKGEIYVENI